MNKKFSTLMALALLAGSLPVAAENTTKWIPVTPDQLVNGAEYVIYNGSGDSIMFNGKVSKNLYSSSSEDGPVFLKSTQTSDKDSVWTLALTGKQFTLTPTTKDGKTENVNSVYGYNNILFTNTSSTPTSFSLSSEGLLTVGKNYVYAAGPRGAYGFKIDGTQEQASKFSFFMKKEVLTTDSIPNNMEEKDVVEGAVYVVDGDGKYIGIKSSLLRAAGGSLVATYAKDFIALTPEEKKAYVWIPEAKALKSAYASTPIYLNVNAKGVYISSTTSVDVTIGDGILSTASGNAEARFVTSEIQKPFEGDDFYNAGFDEKDGKYFIKDANGIVLYAGNDSQVVDAEGNLVGYNSNDAVETVWALTPHETSTKGVYELRLTDKEGNFLTVDGKFVTVDGSFLNWSASDAQGQVYNVYSFKNDDATVLLRAGGKYVGVVGGQLQVVDIYQATEFGLGNIQVAYISAETLLKRYGEYFTLDITYLKGEVGQTDLTSIFEGQLCPMSYVGYVNGSADYVKAAPTDRSFMLVNEKGEILAVNKNADDRLSEGSYNHVYPLTTITPHEYVLDQAGDKNYDVYFKFEYIPGQEAQDVTILTNIWIEGNVIGCYLDKTVPTLAAADNVSLKKVSFDLNKGTLVDAASWLNQPAYYTVEVLNKAKDAAHKGQVLGLNENGAIDYVAATKTDINRPEGQFAISYNVNTGNYDFTNRETGETAWSLLMGDRLYKISSTEFAYLHGSHMDTLAIKPVTTYKSYDGFRRYSAADLNNNTYNIAMNLLDESFLYVVENHNDKHRIGLDREEATEWRIEIPTVKLLDAASDVKAIVADTVKVSTPIKYWKDNTWVYTDDKTSKNVDGSYKYYDPNTVLEICTYILKNTDTDEYMMGSSQAEEKANEYYYCPSKTQATRVALKLVGDSTVNLVPVYSNYWYEETDNYGNRWTVSFRNWNKDRSLNESQYNEYTSDPYSKLSLSENKIIGGTTSATGVLKDVALYQATSNDLFVIKDAAAPTYKKMEQGQKIVISREENNDEVIYEKGEFAGISNRVAYKDINPTLYVDTAYVNRDGNYRYEYLLGVNINRVDTVDDCGNPNHEHPRTVFTEGRFLVNMRDSADANTNVHNNKFEYDGESKLAFVAGYHQNDTLYITDEAGKVIAKSEVGNAAPHFAKFAFKMIDETNNEFVVEVGESAAKQYVYKNGSWTTVTNVEASRGYLKWHNGNLVVTPYLDQAEHFTMEASDKEATANEAISAGNVVVAGTNGAVVVKGAEGKNVIVSTILGKVVANEVVSSDNAQITAPAGIVVVSVDGESFKVVVK